MPGTGISSIPATTLAWHRKRQNKDLASLGTPSVAVFVDKESICQTRRKAAIAEVSFGVSGIQLKSTCPDVSPTGHRRTIWALIFRSVLSQVSGDADGTFVTRGRRCTALSISARVFHGSCHERRATGNQIANAGLAAAGECGPFLLAFKALNAGVQNAVKPIPIDISQIEPIDIAGQLRAIPGVVRSGRQADCHRLRAFAGAVPLIDDTGLTALARMSPKARSSHRSCARIATNR